MIGPTHVDGNALGGLLHDAFGREMTAVIGCCRDCGATNPLGALHVYLAAPGYVIRCPGCESVLFVIVVTGSDIRVSYQSLRSMQMPTGTDRPNPANS
jgi:hypothetical protein